MLGEIVLAVRKITRSCSIGDSLKLDVIERAFGLLKKRWAILRSPSFYPLQVQNHIILACILLQNFIRTRMVDDLMDIVEEDGGTPIDDTHHGYITSLESSVGRDSWRYEFAMSMWNTYN